MSVSLITPDPAADALRRTRLRRMRVVAVSLLGLAAVVYVATLGQDGWVGYVNAGAEASMVGAIADWFAVTALFKHPMGLPIPHTALIPKRKDELGRSLEEFVSENFLQEQVIRDRLTSADVSRRIGTWVSLQDNADRVVREAATLLALGLRRVRDEDVASMVDEVVVPRLLEEPVSPVVGRLLAEVVRDGAHHGFVDLLLEEANRWLVHHQDTFTAVVGERAPWWSPPKLSETVTERLHLEAVRWIADIRADPHHSAREALDSALADLAEDLLTDPETQQRAERLKNRVLEHPQLAESGISIWNALSKALVEALENVDGPLRHRAVKELTTFGVRLVADERMRAKIDAWGADLVVFAIGRYGDEITAIITQTVARWDGKEAASKIELHVGRDLQFIRINGTIVGGLVGLVIHTASELLT